MMADRAPPPAAGRDDRNAGMERHAALEADEALVPKVFRADTRMLSDGMDSFKYAIASNASPGPGAQTPPVQHKQLGDKHQKTLLRMVPSTKKAHGTAALLNMDNLTQLKRPTFPVYTTSSPAPTFSEATLNKPTISENNDLRQNAAVKGMTDLLTSIEEATEPPTSSPNRGAEGTAPHSGVSHGRFSGNVMSSGRSTPLSDRIRKSQQATNSQLSMEGKAQMASAPSPFRNEQTGDHEKRRVPFSNHSSVRAMESLPSQRMSAPAIPKSHNPFKRNSQTPSAQQSRSGTPLEKSQTMASVAQMSESCRNLPMTKLSGHKRSFPHASSSKSPSSDNEDEYDFSDLEDFPMEALQPPVKKAKGAQPNVAMESGASSHSRSSFQRSTASPGQSLPPRASQRPSRPAGVYGSRTTGHKEVTQSQFAESHATAPVSQRMLQPVPLPAQLQLVQPTQPSVLLGDSDSSKLLATPPAHTSSSPGSSNQTTVKILDPELDKMLHDVLGWYKTFHSTASSLERLNENVERKRKKINEQEEELKKLRNVKDEFQASQMETFELRFKKEELEAKITELHLDCDKARQAVDLARREIEREKAEREADLVNKCANVLTDLGGLLPVHTDHSPEYSRIFLDRMNAMPSSASVLTVFEDVLKTVLTEIRSDTALSATHVADLERRIDTLSLDLIKAQHTVALESSSSGRLEKEVVDLERALNESKTALVLAEKRGTSLQDGFNEHNTALRDAMSTINELKKQIMTSKDVLDQQRQEQLKEKIVISELLAVSQERVKTLQERISVLAAESADIQQELQIQRSRADGAQGQLDAERRMHGTRLAEVEGQHRTLLAEMTGKERELSSTKIQIETLAKQLKDSEAKLQNLQLIESSSRDGEHLNAQLILFLREVWNRLHGLHDLQTGASSQALEVPVDILALKLAITSKLQDVQNRLEALQKQCDDLEEDRKLEAAEAVTERTSRVTADLLVQQHCSTISSLQEQIRTLTNDRDERERKAGSQIQVLLSARAEQENLNGSLTAQVKLLAEANDVKQQELRSLRIELQTAETQTRSLQTEVEAAKRDFTIEIDSLKAQLERTVKTSEERFKEIHAIKSQNLVLQEKLSSSLQVAEELQTDLTTTENELATISSQHALQAMQLAEVEKVHAQTLEDLRRTLAEESKARVETESQQKDIQQSMQQIVAENDQLKERLLEESKLVVTLRKELEDITKASDGVNSPERKEQLEQVKKHYRQEISIKDNEIKKLQRKLRDSTDRQVRLSQQVSQLKNHPTVLQSQSPQITASQLEAEITKSLEDPDSSLTAIPGWSSESGSGCSDGHKDSRKSSPEKLEQESLAQTRLSSPIGGNVAPGLSDLAQTSSAESSQSSLRESQIIRPTSKQLQSTMPSLSSNVQSNIDGFEFDDDEGSQSSNWLRRSTRRSRSASNGTTPLVAGTLNEGANKAGNATKRVRRI